MLKKLLKCLGIAALITLLVYNAVYFKKLSSMKTSVTEKFDAVSFSKKLWQQKLPAKLDSAIEITKLFTAIHADPAAAFNSYSNAMGIGNFRYSLVNVKAVVTEVNPDEIFLQLPYADSTLTLKLATEYVYGNAIRDASGLVDIKDFTNNMDLNNISEELNKKVRKEILPPFKAVVKKGDRVNIIAAIELNQQHIQFNNLELIPVRLKVIP